MDLPPPVLLIFNLSTGEIIVVVLLILVLFGAHKIPEFARALGRAQREFQRARDEAVAEPPGPKNGDEERLRRAARDLGIDPSGKSTDELRAAISAKVQSGPATPP